MMASNWLPWRWDVRGLTFALGLALSWAPPASQAGERYTHSGGCVVENWQLEQGLPQISVTSIAQTKDGYLWVGTFNGLARFDGVHFTVFDEGNSPGLTSSGITHLAADEEGALWIVTVTGSLVRWAAGRFEEVLTEEALLPSGDVCFLHDSTGQLFLLDHTDQVRQIEHGHVLAADVADRSWSLPASSLLFDEGGGSWVVRQGIATASSRTPFPIWAGSGDATNRTDLVVDAATPSRSGGFWVIAGRGIHRLHHDRLSARLAELPSGISRLGSLREDGQGNLWAGAWGMGVFRLDAQGAWQHFRAGQGLSDNYVNCLFSDREGSLWVGTGQGGLYRFGSRPFQVYDTAESSQGGNAVTSVTQDRQGRLWFGVNGGGLQLWSGARLERVTEPDFPRQYALVYSVLADRHDAIWIGLYGEALLRRQTGTVTRFDLGFGDRKVMTPQVLFEDRAGTLWIGCADSLMRYDRDRFTRYTAHEGLTSTRVMALAEDRSGTLYVGTDGGGLNCLRQGRFTAFTERDGLSEDHLSSLYADRDDVLWIGTAHRGLCRFKNGRFDTIDLKAGLPSNNIGTLLADDEDNLWIGSNRGIVRVSRRALNDYAEGDRRPLALRGFGLSDGLHTLGCSGGSQPASCKAQDGRLWFATVNGAAVVDPKQLRFNSLPPPVVIEEVLMDDRARGSFDPEAKAETPRPLTVAADGAGGPMSRSPRGAAIPDAAAPAPGLTVPAQTHRLEFRFTALSLVAPEKVRFRYRLDPFDRDWTEAGTRRVAYYTGIPPGGYRFQVLACNNDGVWNETGAALNLRVLPPWWRTWWFRALMALGIGSLVFGGYELRLHRLRREQLALASFSRRLIALQEQERRRIAGELHDGLGQDLLVIASQAQLSLRHAENPPTTTARLQDIAETAKQAVQQARRMAHNLRPGLVEELGFTKAVQATVDRSAQSSGLSIAASLATVDGLLPADFEANLFRIIQESLSNIIRHAGASEASVAVSRETAGLRLVVEDKGRGFELHRLEATPPERRGFGLRQIAERARMMGGRMEIRSSPGQGTRLVVEIPWPRSHAHG